MPAPDGLDSGFGIARPARSSLCWMRANFGIGDDGLMVYRAGTGFFFRQQGPSSLVLTAGHIAYHHQYGFAKWIALGFEQNGDASLAQRDARSWRVQKGFVDAGYPDPALDFAVVRVAPLETDRFTPIGLGTATATGDAHKTLVGYPNEGVTQGTRRPYHADVVVRPSGTSNYDYADQPTYDGMSGGPLLSASQTAGDAALYAYGLHIHGATPGDTTRGVRFTADVQRMIGEL